MRIGPWVFGTGLLLLAAGVVSTSADAWDTRVPALTIPLAMDGIETIDIRGSGIRKVAISGKGPAQVHYPEGIRYAWMDEDKQAAPPSCQASGKTLQCKAGTQFMPGTPTMRLPPGRYRLLADDTRIEAESELESLAIEVSGQVNWAGPVDELAVVLVPPPQVDKEESYCAAPGFTYSGGRVRSLRIRASAGSLSFDPVSDVGEIEVQAARDVQLTVDRAADIARIKVLPLEASADAATGEDTRETCGNAIRAAARAARG